MLDLYYLLYCINCHGIKELQDDKLCEFCGSSMAAYSIAEVVNRLVVINERLFWENVDLRVDLQQIKLLLNDKLLKKDSVDE